MRIPFVVAVVVAAILSNLAGAPEASEQKIAFSERPLFLEPRDDTVVLYLVRDAGAFYGAPSKRKAIYLDGEPLGYLSTDSYLVAEVGPGLRGLRAGKKGTTSGWHWIDLKAGRSYILFLETFTQRVMDLTPVIGPSAATGSPHESNEAVRHKNVTSLRWWLGPPRDVPAMVAALGLKHVTTTEVGMANLRSEKERKKFDKLIAKKKVAEFRDAARIELPLIEEETLPCKVVDEQMKYKRGRLTIDFMELVWQSDSKRIGIPIEEIRRIDAGQYDILIGYGSGEELRMLVLYAKENPRYERILLHLLDAMHSPDVPDDSPE